MQLKENAKGKLTLYIEWQKDAQIYFKSRAQMNKLVEFLQKNYPLGYLKVRNSWNRNPDRYITKTRLFDFCNSNKRICWTIDIDPKTNDTKIYIGLSTTYKKNGYPLRKQYIFSTTRNVVEDDDTAKGTDGYKLIDNKFKDIYGKSVNEAFGYLNGMKEPKKMEFFKRIQPMTLVWLDYNSVGKYLINYQKCDASSMYPYACSVANLPDIHTELKVKGFAELKDYPEYDFIVRSDGHVIERNMLDTRQLYAHKYANKMNKKVTDIIKVPEEEYSYLYKRSTYSMRPVFEYFYQLKETSLDRDAIKSAMVSFIGCFQSTKYSKLYRNFKGALSVFVYLRAIKYIFDKIDYVEANNGKLVQIATDSISWTGPQLPEVSTRIKKLGNFIREYSNADACVKGCGVYAIKVDPTGPNDASNFKICMQGTSKKVSAEFKKKMKSVKDIMKSKCFKYELVRIPTKYRYEIFHYTETEYSMIDYIVDAIKYN